jgi:hypothetical protein
MLKYHPYKSDKQDECFYVVTNSGKKVYFGAAGMSDFTKHKDEARKQRYVYRHKNNEMWTINQVLTQLASGLAGCFGISQPLKKDIMI